MIKAIISDMDGTLFLGHKATLLDLSDRNEVAIAHMKQEGIDLYVASGRMVPYGVKLLEKYGFKDVKAGGYNGAIGYDNGEIKYAYTITPAIIYKVLDLVEQDFVDTCETMFLQTVDAKRIFRVVNHPISHKFRKEMSELGIGEVPYYSIREYAAMDEVKNAQKLTMNMNSHEAAVKLSEALQDLVADTCFITFSSDKVVEVGNIIANKGTFVKYIKDSCGYSEDEVAVIGDALNDAEMFPESNFSFAMASGSDDCKKKANYMVEDVAECIEWCINYNKGR
ncbi:MAG: HAD family phosphatase [Erysipelotrichaceae bacterium]|nr:HAD family phosphatase [Erysipelotrichaceae bacterium]